MLAPEMRPSGRDYEARLPLIRLSEFPEPPLVTADIQYPGRVMVGFWILFLYSFSVYINVGRKELEAFSFKNGNDIYFFCNLNRLEFNKKLQVESALNYLQAGQGKVEIHDDSKTVVRYELEKVPTEILPKITGFDIKENTYCYLHTDSDRDYFKKSVAVIRPSLRYNYLVYIFPAHLGAALLSFRLVEIGYQILS